MSDKTVRDVLREMTTCGSHMCDFEKCSDCKTQVDEALSDIRAAMPSVEDLMVVHQDWDNGKVKSHRNRVKMKKKKPVPKEAKLLLKQILLALLAGLQRHWILSAKEYDELSDMILKLK